MYARGINKQTVRASPSFRGGNVFPVYPSDRDESSYGAHLPPRYDGSRFSRAAPETETKHHQPTIYERGDETGSDDVYPSSTEMDADVREQQDDEGTARQDNDCEELPCPLPPEEKDCPKPSPLGDLMGSLRDRVSGEDLLLIVIILTLALEGENAEITILLLSLLLLVK
ncbi:MAG: hypothetical protein E7638_07840 [Ruminococcaceae bacterium]|nr:hypothetical protein [Oscillospiraceae bacterium]